MNATRDSVTIVVPAKGRPELTRRLLDSLVSAQLTCPVILVDDGTPTPLAKSIGEVRSLHLSIVRNERSVGPAASRNIGLWLARTEYVAFTDNDVAVTSKWLPALLAHIERAPHDVAGVGGRVVDDGTCLVGKYATQLHLLDPYVHLGRVVYLVTANCIFRRHALLEIGGFDESFTVPGGEDPELSFRLLRAGYRLEYQPEAIVVHHYEASWSRFWKLFLRYGRGCRKAMDTLTAD